MFLIILFVKINKTNGVINIPMITYHNHSLFVKQFFNRPTTAYSWKKSNSIEILKKLIANRQIITKTNRTLFLTSKFRFKNTTSFENVKDKNLKVLSISDTTQQIPYSIQVKLNTTTTNLQDFPTTQTNFIFPQKTTDLKQSSNIITLATVIICCFSGLLFLTFIITFLFR
jgi:hypothetical protein